MHGLVYHPQLGESQTSLNGLQTLEKQRPYIMQNTTYTIFIFLITLCGNISIATARDNTQIPLPLKKAVTAYEEKGVNTFIPVLYGTPLTLNSNLEFLNGTSILIKVEKLYGNYTGLEIINDLQISTSTRSVFFIMTYQRGPLYGVITTYKTSDEKEVVMEFKINIERQQIIPDSYLTKNTCIPHASKASFTRL